MTDLQSELNDLKRRVDRAEVRLSQLEGQFEFISGQLRDIQLFLVAKFGEIDTRFGGVERRLGSIEGTLEKLPQQVAVIVTEALRK